MPRLARVVIPDVPHHVTQRGNRRLPIFFDDGDRHAYLELVADACTANGTRCLAWCLMDNHVHLILVPQGADGLRATLGERTGAIPGASTSAKAGAAISFRVASPAMRWTIPT